MTLNLNALLGFILLINPVPKAGLELVFGGAPAEGWEDPKKVPRRLITL